MSVRVLVIPEDPTLNGHILKPLTKVLMRDAGRPSARIQVLENPRVQGYDQARHAIRHRLARFRWHDLWLFFPDADRTTDDAMQRLERDLANQGVCLFCCPAQPEVEIYACVAFRSDMGDAWNDVRKNPRMKEEVFQPLIDLHGDPRRAGGGRDLMIRSSLSNLPLLYQLCPELKVLRDRIAAFLQSR